MSGFVESTDESGVSEVGEGCNKAASGTKPELGIGARAGNYDAVDKEHWTSIIGEIGGARIDE